MLRSYLYVPGDKPELIAKARRLSGVHQPDALLLDLEDAVAVSQKAVARANIAALTASPPSADGPMLFVRINAGEVGLADVVAVAGPSLVGVCVPKASTSALREVGRVFAEVGLRVAIIALVETAAGLSEIQNIALSEGVTRLALGEADLCSELGIASGANHALWPLRMQAVVASAAAGIEPPIGPISTDFRNLDQFSASSELLLQAGFAARQAIHPAQISVINQIMQPSAEALAAAAETVALYDSASTAGRGVTVDSDGRMLDEAVVRAARRLLSFVETR